ncbi:MAG: glycosyltransferase family 39 protein [Isosphaeraceae bacterium]
MLPPIDPTAIRAALRHPIVEACLLACLAITIHLAGNGRTSLWDRDEPRYAQCTREMQASGDWIRPTFNGEPRHHKPVLIYWLMMAGYAIGGDNPFGARLVSAVMGTGTVLLTWGLGRKMFGPSAGRLAGLILASAPIVIIEAKLATTDATLACILVAAQSLLWRLSRRDSPGSAMGFWALMAAALLIKGPVGPLLIACAGAASWWWGGPTACWKRLRWRQGLALMVALALPWYAAIGILTRGEFFRLAVGTQIVGRVVTGLEEHGAPPGYYVATTLVGFYLVVGDPADRPVRGLEAAAEPARPGLPAGLDGRALAGARMRQDQADPLLPARPARLRPARLVDDP